MRAVPHSRSCSASRSSCCRSGFPCRPASPAPARPMPAVRGRRRAASSACLRRRSSRGFERGNASLVREHQRTRALVRTRPTEGHQRRADRSHLRPQLPDSLDRARIALNCLAATGEKAGRRLSRGNSKPDTSGFCRSLCDNRDMSSVQNNGGATGGVTGKGFRPGRSGNPGGRPQGLARATRELVGEDGKALVELWWSIARTRPGATGTGSKPPSSWPTGVGARLRPSSRRRATRSTWLRLKGPQRSSERRFFVLHRASRTTLSQSRVGCSAPRGAHLLGRYPSDAGKFVAWSAAKSPTQIRSEAPATDQHPCIRKRGPVAEKAYDEREGRRWSDERPLPQGRGHGPALWSVVVAICWQRCCWSGCGSSTYGINP